MKAKRTSEEINLLIEQYFHLRRVLRRDKDGEPMLTASGEFLYDEKPYTITGLALALGYSSREELFEGKDRDKKAKALVDRALLRIEESAEEKLFRKETYNGTKLFLAANFPRWGEGVGMMLPDTPDLGICTDWAK